MDPSASPERFDPLGQNVTFLGPDGRTPIAVPVPAIDAYSDLSVSVTLNYGIQIGACLVMLLVVLAVTTPSSKLRRPSALLHVLALAVVVVRNSLLVAYFLSPIVHFYPLYSGDFSSVPRSCLYSNVAGNTMSLVLVVVVEAALMNQAWTMVTLWPDPAKYGIAAASLLVTLLTIGFRVAYTVIQNQAALAITPAVANMWVVHGAVITNAISIFWFCALFNLKLVMHLVQNRGILPSAKTLTSMELLVMTNGILMIVPGTPPFPPQLSHATRQLTLPSYLRRPRMGHLSKLRSRLPDPHLRRPHPPPGHHGRPANLPAKRHRQQHPQPYLLPQLRFRLLGRPQRRLRHHHCLHRPAGLQDAQHDYQLRLQPHHPPRLSHVQG